MMKKILVTGGAGFLGSHLCDRLIEQGHQVICLDSLFTGNTRNIENLKNYKAFTFIKHDVVDPINIDTLDEIYNLACPASPVHYQYNPIHTMKTSVLGALNVLELARLTGAKVFQASTSEVYGDPTIHPQPEDYWGNVNTIGIRSCYDEGKRAAETLFFDYQRTHNLRIKVVRIFNTYGPRMAADDGRVVSNFIVQALMDQDITIFGTGLQTRSFCYVDDLIEGFIRFMDTPIENNGEAGFPGPINLGNPTEFTMIELAQTIIRLTHSKSKLEFMPLPTDDPMQRKPDITLAKNHLNWLPKTDLELGLLKTIDFFSKKLSS